MAIRQAQIHSDLETIGHILTTDFRYKVPPYQRNFSWTSEEVNQLWDDITDAMDEDRPEYFLGTIVVHEQRDEKTRTIIDGQQRLATLSMMLAAIRTVYAENDDERAGEVYSAYLGMKDRRTRVTESRLSLNDTNEPTFQAHVVENASDAMVESALKDKSLTSSNHLVVQAMKILRDSIRSKSKPKHETFLIDLEEFIRDRIVAILVRVGDESDAYLIFETLNDRGLELSISDLLKNYLFGKAGTRLSTVRKQWEEIVFLLGNQNQTQFLRHYWLSRYGVVRERDLYKEMKQKFASQSAILKLMGDLRDAADKYAAVLNVDHSTWKEYGTSVRRDLESLQLFGLSQFRPLLIAGLESLEPDQLAKLLRVVVVVSMRYSIIGSLGTGNIEKAYSDAAIRVRERKADTAAKVFALLKNIYPDEDRFEADFSLAEISKPKLARYILACIGNHVQGNKAVAILDDEKQVNLEHVMPKTRTSDWVKAAVDEDEYLDYVNRLGNLTLIEYDKNKVASSASFEKKKDQAYKCSGIKMTADLRQFNQWTVAEIEKRQQELAKIALKVWNLPY
ncbi:MAG: DUF262 domain-containing protein [Bryobacteraceae bacterium]